MRTAYCRQFDIEVLILFAQIELTTHLLLLVSIKTEDFSFAAGGIEANPAETELYFLGSRYYDPEVGRFISPDVIAEGGNLYAYCQNDPVNRYDPSGYRSMFIGKFWSGLERTMDKLNKIAYAIDKHVVTPIKNIVEDIKNFDINNTNASEVFHAHYLSGYKGQLVFKGSLFDGASGSFGRFMYLDDGANLDVLLHEHGHYIQYKELGFIRYTFGIAIPSVRHVNDSLTNEQYRSQPWEVTADMLGGTAYYPHLSGSEVAGWRYYNKVKYRFLPVIIIDAFRV